MVEKWNKGEKLELGSLAEPEIIMSMQEFD